jgi:two-component system, NtrC family, sensor kinase
MEDAERRADVISRGGEMKATGGTSETPRASMEPDSGTTSAAQGIGANDVFARVPDALYCLDGITGEYTRVNRAFESLVGYSIVDLKVMGGRRGFLKLKMEAFPESTNEHLADRVEAIDNSPRCEMWLRTKDGSLVCLQDEPYPLEGTSEFSGSCRILRNVTDCRLQELKLRKELRLLRTVIDNLPDPIYAKDTQGRKTLANPADVRNMIGCSAESDVLGKDDFALFPREIAESFFADDQAVVQTGKAVVNREEFFFDAEGRKRWLLTTKIPIRDRTGKVEGLVGIGRDITVRKRSEEALRLFRTLVDRSSDMFEILDPQDGRFIDANETALRALGYTREELLSLTLADIDPDFDGDVYRKTVLELKETGGSIIRRVHRRKDGTAFPVEASVSFVDLDREYVVSVVRDISKKVKAEDALKQSEERFRLISENLVDLMVLLDNSGTCLYASPSHYQDGLRPEALIGSNYLSNIHEDDLDDVRDRINRVALAGGPQATQFRLRRGDGSWHFKDATFTLLVDDSGFKVLVVARDITDRIAQDEERLALETKLCERNSELESTIAEVRQMQQGLIQSEKMASIGQLTAGIAHEINNPLAFVSSNLNRFTEYFECLRGILRGWGEAKAALSSRSEFDEILQRIKRLEDEADLDFIVNDFGLLMKHTTDGTERIRSIVDRLRGFSHMADNKSENADINAAIDDTINLTWNELKYKATIVKEFSKIPPVKCNIGEIKQVLVNLLVNAAHALPEKGTITLRTFTNDTDLTIEVEDTGHGIAEENLKRIFDPFFTTKAVGKGTGLGLWISMTIIQKHKGTLTVRSTVGKGTTMTIRLPLEVQDVQASGG